MLSDMSTYQAENCRFPRKQISLNPLQQMVQRSLMQLLYYSVYELHLAYPINVKNAPITTYTENKLKSRSFFCAPMLLLFNSFLALSQFFCDPVYF